MGMKEIPLRRTGTNIGKPLTPQTADQVRHVQQLLNPPTPQDLAKLREAMSGLVGEYINWEDQKKAADADYNKRMGDLWDRVRALRARITEGEEAAG